MGTKSWLDKILRMVEFFGKGSARAEAAWNKLTDQQVIDKIDEVEKFIKTWRSYHKNDQHIIQEHTAGSLDFEGRVVTSPPFEELTYGRYFLMPGDTYAKIETIPEMCAPYAHF